MRRELAEERGASLIMAIVIVVLVGALVAALLDMAGVQFRSTQTIRAQREYSYAADGAVEAVIEALRRDANADVCAFEDTDGESWTIAVGAETATATCAFAGADHGLEIDRIVEITGKDGPSGPTRVVATVTLRDSQAAAGTRPVDISAWKYQR